MTPETEAKYRQIADYITQTGQSYCTAAMTLGVAESTAYRAMKWAKMAGHAATAAVPAAFTAPATTIDIPAFPPSAPQLPPSFGDPQESATAADISGNGAGIPEADTDTVPPFVFDGDGHGLCLSDMHLPYHDPQALALAIQDGQKHGANHVILDGDVLDFYQASRFARSARAKSIPEEVECGRQFFEWLRESFPRARIVYKIGNHEQRFERYVQTKARDLEGLEGLTVPEMLHCDDYGVEAVAENQFVYYGGLTIAHGHEFGRSIFNPVNPARGAYLRAHACVMVAHHHQSSMHSEPDIRRVLTTCWSLGCLCGLAPKYAPHNKWNHGYALTEKDGELFRVTNRRIIDGGIF